jgi:aminoglycoside phosphotransferase (APT) family kinase protein
VTSSETSTETPQRSSRDPGELRARLQRWLAGRLGEAARPEVSEVSSPSATGMSSETLLFEASWSEAGARRAGAFVARVEPDPADVPVFPVYDLESQFKLIRLVEEHSDVPVPKARWLELDPTHLGARFFVMDKVDGRVPPDIMPYNMGSWLLDADPADQRKLQDAAVGVLAALHAISPTAVDASFLEIDLPGATPLRRHVAQQRNYYDWVRGDRRHPLLERTFDWLESQWPADEGETVICWGDARIGNILFDGFTPAAVLDWEMATLGPRGLDVGWMIFIHVFFEDIARQAGLPGMPHFLRRDHVAATYAARTGHEIADLPFYETYAALRHGIVMARVHARRVHFGEVEWPTDPDEVVMHRAVLARMIDGTYWS